MARVLVTRPEPDNAHTAQALRARGHAPILAPLMVMHPAADVDLGGAYAGLILTSANALRAIRHHPHFDALRVLPAYAVGEASASEARDAGFGHVIAGEGDAGALVELLVAHFRKTEPARLLYLAGAQISHDISGALRDHGIEVDMRVVYRMDEISPWPPAAAPIEIARGIDAVLHYSARSARLFCVAMREAALDARAAAHACLSEQVARVLREEGLPRVGVADRAQEKALLDALECLLSPPA